MNAMQRLSYILIALTLGFAPSQGQAQDSSYSIAGDVSSPQSHRYPKGQQVHLRDLLDDAGYNNASGVARILRGTPLRTVTSDSVTPEMTSRGSLLLPGDVVVFRSFDGHCPGEQNALAMLDSGPVLLQIPGGGYPASLLFEHNQIPPEGRISVTRTRNGSASEVNLSHHEFIQHGDVINLGDVSLTAGLRTSHGYATTPGFAEKRMDGVPSLNSVAELQPAIEIAAEERNAPSTSLFSVPPVESPSAEVSPTPSLLPSPTDAGQMLLQTDDTRHAHTIADDDPFQMASLETLSDIPAMAAQPPAPAASVGAETPNNAWNALFIAGLAMATGLIVFGWLKTKQEQAAMNEFVDGLQDSHITDERIEIHTNELVTAPTAFEQISEACQPPMEVSKATENFTVSVISGDCPILSAGLDEFETMGAQTFDAAPESLRSETTNADHVTRAHRDGTIDSAILEIQPGEWFEGAWLHKEAIEDSNENVTVAHDAASAEQAAQVEAAAATDTISPQGGTFSDLEELLQNQVPVDISQADLPLRIALFGNPAGPRRLRIDAAHTQLAPPHMMKSARQEQKSRPTVAPVSDSNGNDASSQPADMAAANADYERFDRALDLLEGQSDS
jgi:hypothetical protein